MSNKDKARQIAEELNATFGKGTVRLGSDPSLRVTFMPTGVLPVDVLLQGGFPRGRITEGFGDYSSMKTYVGLKAVATTQANGGVCAIVDTERVFDPEWLESLGGRPDEVIVEQPETGEEAVAVCDMLIRSNLDFVMWDSIAATMPLADAERKPGEDNQPGRLAQLMSKGLRRLVTANSGYTAVYCTNQTRMNIGVTFGSPETTPGGKALPFYASYRIRFTKAGRVTVPVKVHDGEKFINAKEIVGQKIRMTLEKSKLNRPLRESWFVYDLKHVRVDNLTYMITAGLEHGLVESTNSRFKLPYWDKTVHGMPKFRESLTEEDQQWIQDGLLMGTEAHERVMEEQLMMKKAMTVESSTGPVSDGKPRRLAKKKVRRLRSGN